VGVNPVKMECYGTLQGFGFEGKMEGFCGHGNGPSGPIQDGAFTDQITDYRLLRKNSAPWSYVRKTNAQHRTQCLSLLG
jgi:hypothetical protein